MAVAFKGQALIVHLGTVKSNRSQHLDGPTFDIQWVPRACLLDFQASPVANCSRLQTWLWMDIDRWDCRT